jgi:hypothetical protein
VAILGRFVLRSGSGEVVLPHIVDDSIGMWVLRKVTGRRLGERQPEDDADDEAGGVAVMAASAPPATGIAPAERPIRILALPPATIDATPWAADWTRPATNSVDHLARRARPAALPTRYRAVDGLDDPGPSADRLDGPADRPDSVRARTMGPSG